jgi:8-oxo-dGTP diphosphatase
MKNTTLCYLEKDEKYLMLYRNKKKNDENGGKWIGIGGKFENRESPEECARREIFEETGLRVNTLNLRGIITFDNDMYETEYMFLFTSDDFEGELLPECNEGELSWIDKKDILNLNLWEGDRYFLDLIRKNSPFFSMKLTYSDNKLVSVQLNGDYIKNI